MIVRFEGLVNGPSRSSAPVLTRFDHRDLLAARCRVSEKRPRRHVMHLQRPPRSSRYCPASATPATVCHLTNRITNARSDAGALRSRAPVARQEVL